MCGGPHSRILIWMMEYVKFIKQRGTPCLIFWIPILHHLTFLGHPFIYKPFDLQIPPPPLLGTFKPFPLPKIRCGGGGVASVSPQRFMTCPSLIFNNKSPRMMGDIFPLFIYFINLRFIVPTNGTSIVCHYSVHPWKGRVVLPQFPLVLWTLGHWHYKRTLYSRRPLKRDWSFYLSYKWDSWTKFDDGPHPMIVLNWWV